jgi:hypothetical protein
MEPEGSLLCSQEPVTGPSHEPDASSPHTPSIFLLRSVLVSSHLCLGLLSGGHDPVHSLPNCSFMIHSYIIPSMPWSSEWCIPFSFILRHNVCSSFIVTEQVAHPHKTTDQIIVVCIVFYIFRWERERQKILYWMVASIPQIYFGCVTRYSYNSWIGELLQSRFN